MIMDAIVRLIGYIRMHKLGDDYEGWLEFSTKNLAIEYAKDGIRFNAVTSPALGVHPCTANDPHDSTLQPPMKKATAKDVVDVVLYLTRAGHVSGEILPVDGAAPARRW